MLLNIFAMLQSRPEHNCAQISVKLQMELRPLSHNVEWKPIRLGQLFTAAGACFRNSFAENSAVGLCCVMLARQLRPPAGTGSTRVEQATDTTHHNSSAA